ncbi:unnamed protein product [Strongylus vulgaris]|uniref:Uncharacterized protein n=1 Tax=Strongylus vulgaris TaxID=40348 RepID=A0A3P7IAL3_STRVU|nr:unnamed protein product [Strongylus vulgaris]
MMLKKTPAKHPLLRKREERSNLNVNLTVTPTCARRKVLVMWRSRKKDSLKSMTVAKEN